MNEFIDKLTSMGLVLEVGGESLLLKGQQGKLTDEEKETIKNNKDLIQFISRNKQRLITFLNADQSQEKGTEVTAEVEDTFPLSPMQEGLLFHSMYDQVSHNYMDQLVVDLVGPFDQTLFFKSWEHLMVNHAVLRTGFYQEQNEPKQFVLKEAPLKGIEIDLSSMDEKTKERQVEEFLVRDLDDKFNFENPPLFRITIIKLQEQRHKVVWTNHHLISDGWSTPLLVGELLEAYSQYNKNETPQLRRPDNYSDYVEFLQGQDLVAQERFWKSHFKNFREPTLLPFLKSTSKRNKSAGKLQQRNFILPAEFVEILSTFTRQHQITINSVLQGIWAYLFSKYCGKDTVSIGMTASGRPLELEDALNKVGLYVNTVPFCIDVDDEQHTIKWLKDLQQENSQVREYQYCDLSKIQQWSGIEGDLFDHILVYENYPTTELEANIDQGGFKIENIRSYHQSNYPLVITIEKEKVLEVSFKYNSALLEEGQIEAMANQYRYLLEQVVNFDDVTRLKELQLIDEVASEQELLTFHGESRDFTIDDSIINAFARTVKDHGEKIAVLQDEVSLTYQELDHLSNELAIELITAELKGARIGIMLDRSPEMIIAILGILKVGGAYVPLDVTYPDHRIQFMIEDSGIQSVISTGEPAIRVKRLCADLQIFELGEQDTVVKSSHQPDVEITKESLAYLMYTSGSTGRPKGTLIAHQSVLRLVFNQQIEVSSATRMLGYAPLAFDASTFEIFGSLLNGGTLILANAGRQSLDNLARTLTQNSVNTIWLAAGLCHIAIREKIELFSTLKHVLAGGDSINYHLVRQLLQKYPYITFYNGYGPTECTTFSVVNRVRSDDSLDATTNIIGRPIENTWIQILDEFNRKCPVGVIGEITISGIGLAQGYLNDDKLTASKFPYITNAAQKTRVYKTGDLGRWLPDGKIEFLGRQDFQVKISGHRVELLEVEKQLHKIPEVGNVSVLTTGSSFEKQLVGFLEPQREYVVDKVKELTDLWEQDWNKIFNIDSEKMSVDSDFDLTGWVDSFTGQEIGDKAMKAWQSDIIRRILSVNPKRVIELGTGSGLIYFPLATTIDRYVGYDLSDASIQVLKTKIRESNLDTPETVLDTYPARLFPLDPDQLVDTVILNSVVQYFPSEYYLKDVIDRCCEQLQVNGRIILGDIRHYDLLPDFHERKLKTREKGDVEHAQAKVSTSILNDKELAISPLFFTELVKQHPRIHHVEVEWKQNNFVNELSLFRYEVTLYLDSCEEILSPDWQPWQSAELTIESVRRQLEENQELIAIKGIPNPRLWMESGFRKLREHGAFSLKDVRIAPELVQIQRLLDQAAQKGYVLRRFLADNPYTIDLLLHLNSDDSVCYESPIAQIKAKEIVANVPMMQQVSVGFLATVSERLKASVPAFMIPAKLNMVSQIPLDKNGKIDRKLLLQFNETRSEQKDGRLPANKTEQYLIEQLQELLQLSAVSPEDDFFKIGGHSLLAIRVISAIKKDLGISLEIQEIFDNPVISQLANTIQEKSTHFSYRTIEVGERPELIPLSFSQERLWFIDNLMGTTNYHIPVLFEINGKLSDDYLELALRGVIDRHEILRTIYQESDGKPHQKINDAQHWQLIRSDAANWTEDERHNYVNEFIIRPFDLTTDYVLRAALLTIAPEKCILILVSHHIAFDGWSDAIFTDELTQIYASHVEGRAPNLPDLPLQYADFALWQRKTVPANQFEKKLAYWENKLAGVKPVPLPTDYRRPEVSSSKGETITFSLDQLSLTQLHQLSEEHGSTLFMTLMAAFKVLLYRYSGSGDVCVGTPVANRTRTETENLIGFFVNSLAIRTALKGSGSFSELLYEVKKNTLEAFQNQDVPFERVVEKVEVNRDLSISPVFQTMLSLQNAPKPKNDRIEGLSFSELVFETGTVQLDLSLDIINQDSYLQIDVEYSTELFSRETANRFGRHYLNLLRTIVANPGASLHQYFFLDENEASDLLRFNHKAILPVSNDHSVTSRFEHQVRVQPDKIALQSGEDSLSYAKMFQQVNALSAQLIDSGIVPGDFVGIYLERSFEAIVSMFAILKVGAAFVPIDTTHPKERVNYILSDSRLNIVLTHKRYFSRFEVQKPIDVAESIQLNKPFTKELEPLSEDHPAYIIYTSGSTGNPKGVVINHRGLCSFIDDCIHHYEMKSEDKMLQFSSLTFDTSIEEIFPTLTLGATLVLRSEEMLSNVHTLVTSCDQHQITILDFPTAYLPIFVTHLHSTKKQLPDSVRLVIIGGEQVSADTVNKWLELFQDGSPKLINGYGPTEATVLATTQVIERHNGLKIPIGVPTNSMQATILDDNHMLVPKGVIGQLFLGGAGLASGYLNSPELTRERFSEIELHGSKFLWYKTGDLARWLPDGTIEFMGRADDQVKIRGYRVELGEVEHLLDSNPNVNQSVVQAIEGTSNSYELAAYVNLKGDITIKEVKQDLKKELPDYMVPSFWIEMDAFPLTHTGKIDRKALPRPDKDLTENYVAPSNQIEEKLVSIWEETLEVEPGSVGVHTNFFEIGGHSLMAVRVISIVYQSLNTELSLRTFFTHPTIQELAEVIQERGTTEKKTSLEMLPRPEYVPLSFAQERLYFIDRLGGSTEYNMPMSIRLEGQVSVDALQRSFRALVYRHEILRTVYKENEGVPYQQVMDSESWELGRYEGHQWSVRQLYGHICQLIERPFDLSADFMLRSDLVVDQNGGYILLIVIHHIASDGWSEAILIEELAHFFKAYQAGEKPTLTPLELQYADYAVWQRAYLSEAVFNEKISYWKEALDGVAPLELATDFPRPAIQGTEGHTKSYMIDDRRLVSDLRLLSQKEGVTLFMTLLSVFKVLLYRYSGQKDICIGTPVANRSHPELDPLIGFFVNTLALRTQLDHDLSIAELLQRVRNTTLNGYSYVDIPFEKVVEVIVKERDLSRNPIFQVMFDLQNNRQAKEQKFKGVGLESYEVERTTSLFDLSFSVEELDDGLLMEIEYAHDLYKPETIDRMAGHYEQLLRDIAALDSQHKVGSLEMLTEREKQVIFKEFNPDIRVSHSTQTVIDVFKEKARECPSSIAVKHESESLTYQELDTWSEQISDRLIKESVAGQLVGLCVPRSLEMIAGMFGILKAGSAYVPLDPAYPRGRLDHMLENSQVKVLLTTPDTISLDNDRLMRIEITPFDSEYQISEDQRQLQHHSQSLAYVMYTSGSTGKPKGVMITHDALFNLSWYMKDCYCISDADNMLQFASMSFDMSVEEIFPTLISGATLTLREASTMDSFQQFSAYTEEKAITLLNLPPQFLNGFLVSGERFYEGIRLVSVGGDVLPHRDAELMQHEYPKIQLYNAYGPTENTVNTTLFDFSSGYENETVPIGKPIADTNVFVLNESYHLCPVGVRGELFIGGQNLSSGYYNQPNLTNEYFITNPWNPGAKLYKTGDEVRWLSDGNIDYLGRIDNQVKIRGYRIELTEIEHVLNNISSVKQGIVSTLKKEDGSKVLSGFVIMQETEQFDPGDLIEKLKMHLPDYMVPTLWTKLNTIPLSSNGKIDRESLPVPDLLDSLEYREPQTELEQQLAQIWSQVLDLSLGEISANANFFMIGGHSILSMKLVAKIRDRYQLDLPISVIFRYPTLSELADYIMIASDLTEKPEKVVVAREVL